MIPESMLTLFNLEVPMRDGTVLRGDLYRPAGEGRWPALLLRTVFRKRDMSRSFSQYDPAYYVKRGYAVFIQDVRGLGESDGEFDRFTADGPDGYDTVEWLAVQPWCTGAVGMFGSYFAGYLQIMAALEAPPHLKAVCPMQTSVSINRDCDNRGFLFSSHIGWCMSRLINRLRDGRYDPETTAQMLPKLLGWISDYPRSQLSCLPLASMPALKDTSFPLLKDYRRHLLDGFDDFTLLHKEGRDADLSRMKIPAFYVAGWYDSSRTPLIDHCMTQRRSGIDSRVLIAPWKPGESPARADSALENGMQAVDLPAEIVSWFDFHLKGGPAPAFPPVRYYDITGGACFSGDSWPVKTNVFSFPLAEMMQVPSPSSRKTAGITFRHFPARPLPYRGYGGSTPPDPDDDRAAVLISDPLKEDISVCGLVRAGIFCSADVRDADVMLSLGDLTPGPGTDPLSGGRLFRFCDGAVRLSYAAGWDRKPLSQGEKRPAEILLGHVHYTLRAGHRLIAEFAGSAFPKYDVNHGTGARPAEDPIQLDAVITLYSEDRSACRIDLPLG